MGEWKAIYARGSYILLAVAEDFKSFNEDLLAASRLDSSHLASGAFDLYTLNTFLIFNL